MGDFEKEQQHVQKLYDEFISSDEDEFLNNSDNECVLVNWCKPNTLFDTSSRDSDEDSTSDIDMEQDNAGPVADNEEVGWNTTTSAIPDLRFSESNIGPKINIAENTTPIEMFEYILTP